MAPPGAVPYGRIPQSYMAKQPVPAGEDTNTRAILIFFSYLGLCASLTVFIIGKLLKSYHVLSKSTTVRPPPKRQVYLFAFLAVASLVTTWYHMIKYFQLSYKTWLMWRSYYDLTPDQRHWGLWLKHTSLFREAWEIAVIGFARYWWTHQIFFFASGLGLDLERKGIPRGIKHTWAFMLLGQIVAISFATNLFFLAVLLSPPPVIPAPSGGIPKRKWFGPWLVNLFAILATEIPAYLLADEYYWHSPEFMPVLLTPHIALLVLPFARALLPTKYFSDDTIGWAEDVYNYLWYGTIGGGALLFGKISASAWGYSGFWGIMLELTDHPAVGSVAWDVIFCWVTWLIWWRIQNQASAEPLETEDDVSKGKEGNWIGAGSGTAVSDGDVTTSEMRRR